MNTSPNDDASSAISTRQMPQQLEVIVPGDDWTGVMSAAKRRRLQNCLNQRAYRRKLRQAQCLNNQSGVPIEQGRQVPNDVAQRDSRDPEARSLPNRECRLTLSKTWSNLHQFARQAYRDNILASPRLTALNILAQLNVLNTIGHNAGASGITIESRCNDNAVSPFNRQGPFVSWESLPENLQPTTLQAALRHLPWIDLFPIPQMRDNFIRVCDSIDEDDFYFDLVDIKEEDAGEMPNLTV